MPSTRDSLQIQRHRLKVKRWKRFYANTNKKRAEVAILKSDKTDFKSKKITSNNERYYISKHIIQQEDIIIVNNYIMKDQNTRNKESKNGRE